MLRTLLTLVLAALTSGLALAQSFSQCGTVEAGVTCPKLFRADDMSLWLLDVPLTGFQVGDRLRVVGSADPTCINICQQGNGCIFNTGLQPCMPIVPSFCTPGAPNSTGAPGAISASGSAVIADDDITLTASPLPAGSFAYFIASRGLSPTPVTPPGSVGTLCLSGTIGRFATQVGQASALGVYEISTDSAAGPQRFSLTSFPQPNGPVAVQPGETWYFQCWHRDVAGSSPVSNFTTGLEITFT